jgi:hypothetical protein
MPNESLRNFLLMCLFQLDTMNDAEKSILMNAQNKMRLLRSNITFDEDLWDYIALACLLKANTVNVTETTETL